MAEATGLVITKRFSYRGDTGEEWSNKYWLTGAPPQAPADWHALFLTMANAEKICYVSTTHVVSGYAYDDNTPGANAVWSVDLTATGEEIPGVLDPVGGTAMAGDQAGLLQWKTDRKNSRGKWIYLRKYFHGGMIDIANPDRISPNTNTNYQNFGNALNDGTSLVGNRRLRSQAQDEVLLGAAADDWVTTRTLKRRGKRP